MEYFDEFDTIDLYRYRTGDIVSESEFINPYDRPCWVGIVVYVERGFYEFEIACDVREDLIGVHWFQPNKIEELPSSVLNLIQPMPAKDS